MLRFRCVPVGMLRTACYILYAEGREDCAVIDPGDDPALIRRETEGRHISAILLTHGHFDHIGAVQALADKDTEIIIHAQDAMMLSSPELNASWMIDEVITAPQATRTVYEGDTVEAAGLCLKVLHTPGHTPGSVCYQCENELFTGDTVIGSGWGRTDLPGGSEADMISSLRRILPMRNDLAFHGGHV